MPEERVSAKGDGATHTYADGTVFEVPAEQLTPGHAVHPADPVAALAALEGHEFYYEYLEPTDKLGADVPNPKSHICYGFATHVVILDDEGKVSEVYAAHDSGRVINPIAIQGQIEGGVLMGMGYALTEDWPLKDGVPQAKYGTLGLFRATDIPQINAIYVEKDEQLPVAYGGKGIGEIAIDPDRPGRAERLPRVGRQAPPQPAPVRHLLQPPRPPQLAGSRDKGDKGTVPLSHSHRLWARLGFLAGAGPLYAVGRRLPFAVPLAEIALLKTENNAGQRANCVSKIPSSTCVDKKIVNLSRSLINTTTKFRKWAGFLRRLFSVHTVRRADDARSAKRRGG